MKRLLVLSAAIWLLLALLIGMALLVEHAVAEHHLQRLSAAFTSGACDQPCWRGIQVDKIGLGGVPGALPTVPDVRPANPDKCPDCWTMLVDGVQWQGAVVMLNNPSDYQIALTASPGATAFSLLDAIALFGTPDSVECAIFNIDPLHKSLMTYVTLYFGSGIHVGSYSQLTSFDGYINPTWMIDEVTYHRPARIDSPFVYPWRGFRHVTGRECRPGG